MAAAFSDQAPTFSRALPPQVRARFDGLISGTGDFMGQAEAKVAQSVRSGDGLAGLRPLQNRIEYVGEQVTRMARDHAVPDEATAPLLQALAYAKYHLSDQQMGQAIKG